MSSMFLSSSLGSYRFNPSVTMKTRFFEFTSRIRSRNKLILALMLNVG